LASWSYNNIVTEAVPYKPAIATITFIDYIDFTDFNSIYISDSSEVIVLGDIVGLDNI